MNSKLQEQEFVCLDCETTGTNIEEDSIIEVAAVIFKGRKEISKFHYLIDPQRSIPQESFEIHNISEEMVKGHPTIDKILPELMEFVGDHTIVGHNISFDINIISNEAKRHNINSHISKNHSIDTLRMARIYGKSSNNRLETLREHFNIDGKGAHRAMHDVETNIEVFYRLSEEGKYKNAEDIAATLAKPITMALMPLGKYKNYSFSDIPLSYLRWAEKQDFDFDLKHSIRQEIKKRSSSQSKKKNKKNFSKNSFNQAANPFAKLL